MIEDSIGLFDFMPEEGVVTGCSKRIERRSDFFSWMGQQSGMEWGWVEMKQEHTARVCVIGSSSDKACLSEPMDGLITTKKGLMLVVRTADCLPILIYHPKAVAVVHAGRKGTDMNILGHVLSRLITVTGESDGYMLWFGPRICEVCYEIDRVSHQTYDLCKKNKDVCQALLGVHQILDSGYCTVCDNNRFYSYRANNHTQRRVYSCIGLSG